MPNYLQTVTKEYHFPSDVEGWFLELQTDPTITFGHDATEGNLAAGSLNLHYPNGLDFTGANDRIMGPWESFSAVGVLSNYYVHKLTFNYHYKIDGNNFEASLIGFGRAWFRDASDVSQGFENLQAHQHANLTTPVAWKQTNNPYPVSYTSMPDTWDFRVQIFGGDVDTGNSPSSFMDFFVDDVALTIECFEPAAWAKYFTHFDNFSGAAVNIASFTTESGHTFSVETATVSNVYPDESECYRQSTSGPAQDSVYCDVVITPHARSEIRISGFNGTPVGAADNKAGPSVRVDPLTGTKYAALMDVDAATISIAKYSDETTYAILGGSYSIPGGVSYPLDIQIEILGDDITVYFDDDDSGYSEILSFTDTGTTWTEGVDYYAGFINKASGQLRYKIDRWQATDLTFVGGPVTISGAVFSPSPNVTGKLLFLQEVGRVGISAAYNVEPVLIVDEREIYRAFLSDQGAEVATLPLQQFTTRRNAGGEQTRAIIRNSTLFIQTLAAYPNAQFNIVKTVTIAGDVVESLVAWGSISQWAEAVKGVVEIIIDRALIVGGTKRLTGDQLYIRGTTTGTLVRLKPTVSMYPGDLIAPNGVDRTVESVVISVTTKQTFMEVTVS